MSRITVLSLAIWVAIGHASMAQQSIFDDESDRTSVDKYDLGRFQRRSRSDDPRSSLRAHRSSEAPSRIHDPAVVRVQHSEAAEHTRSLERFDMAQSDFLDDILNESDLVDPAEEPPIPDEAVRAAQPRGSPPAAAGSLAAPNPGPLSPAPLPIQSASAAPGEMPPMNPNAIAPGQPPVPRRSNMMNQPYTLGGLLDDENSELECLCEQEFCEAMWRCAGGRCLSWCQRMARNLDRNRDVLWLGGCGPRNYMSNPMRNWQCSYRQGQRFQGGWGGGDPTCNQGWSGAWPESSDGWQMPYGQTGTQAFPETDSAPMPGTLMEGTGF